MKKINRSIGVISELRYYLNRNTLINLHNALIYPFLIYGIIIWGNTYPTTTHPLLVLQKKATRIMTFSQLDAHSSPLFRDLSILKFPNLVIFHTAIFMHKFYNNMLPSIFTNLFTPVNKIHNYNTRLASKSSYPITKNKNKLWTIQSQTSGSKNYGIQLMKN